MRLEKSATSKSGERGGGKRKKGVPLCHGERELKKWTRGGKKGKKYFAREGSRKKFACGLSGEPARGRKVAFLETGKGKGGGKKGCRRRRAQKGREIPFWGTSSGGKEEKESRHHHKKYVLARGIALSQQHLMRGTSLERVHKKRRKG